MMTALRSWPSWSKQLFQAEPAAGGQVVVLSFAAWWTHSIRHQTANLREHLASNVGTDPQRSFSLSGKRRLAFFFFFFFFFFLLELSSSHLQMDSRMCSAQTCVFWQRGAEPTTCKGPERLLRTSPQLTTSAFLESSSLCHVLCECHNKAGFLYLYHFILMMAFSQCRKNFTIITTRRRSSGG